MVLLGLNARAASAPALGIDPDQAPIETSFRYTNGMIGWSFFVTEPLTITGVGWYDYGHDGLIDSHQIGIWKELSGLPRDQLFMLTNMSLLASATIAAGAEAPLSGPWRTVEIPHLTLEPGGYEVAGTFRNDPGDIFKFASVVGGDLILPDPRIQIAAPTFSFGDEFRAPDQGVLYYGVHLGPMLFMEIPEPTVMPLLLWAMLVLGCRTAHKRL